MHRAYGDGCGVESSERSQSGNGRVTKGRSPGPPDPYAYGMPFGRRRSRNRADVEPERRGAAAFLKRWTIPIIGAVTPVSLIVVNIAAFIIQHLTQFQWTITILAFVSGIMLNSWTALNIYRVLQARRPDNAIVNERNQEVVLVAGMGAVIVLAFLTALFCYLGLAKQSQLPNGLTFFTGFFAMAIPILLRAAFRRGGTPRGRSTEQTRRSPPSEACRPAGTRPPDVILGAEHDPTAVGSELGQLAERGLKRSLDAADIPVPATSRTAAIMICQGANPAPVLRCSHCAQHGHYAVLPAAQHRGCAVVSIARAAGEHVVRAGRKLDGGAATRGRKRRGTDDARTNREGHCARCPRGEAVHRRCHRFTAQDLVGRDRQEHRRRSAHDGE